MPKQIVYDHLKDQKIKKKLVDNMCQPMIEPTLSFSSKV